MFSLAGLTSRQSAGIIAPHTTQRFKRVDDLRQAFFPRAFAGEAGGEVGFGQRDRRGGEDAGDGGDLFGQGVRPGGAWNGDLCANSSTNCDTLRRICKG